MPSPSVSLMADSITRTGDRLITVLARHVDAATLADLGARPDWTVTWPAGGLAIITGGDPARWPAQLCARLDTLAGWPDQVGPDGLHAPFLADTERRNLDIAARAALSASRAAAAGHAGAERVDLARYARLVAGVEAGRAALHHVAVPAEHRVFGQRTARTGEPGPPAGRYRGWVSWGELLQWRGAGPLTDPTREGA